MNTIIPAVRTIALKATHISTVTGFTVLPKTVTIYIEGTGAEGAIPDQTLIDGSIGLAADEDLYVWADFNGNKVEDEGERLNPETDYTFDYAPKAVGESTLIVTPTGNYTGADATKTFTIVKELESITVELNEDTFYVGEKIESTDLTVTAIAEQLNFADQSYLTRFFKRHTGISPRRFRMSFGG